MVVMPLLHHLRATTDDTRLVEETFLLVVILLAGRLASYVCTVRFCHLGTHVLWCLYWACQLTWGLQLVISTTPHISDSMYSHIG
jgi:hypothetical protein